MSRESFREASPAVLDLQGLRIASPQTMGAVRIVPLVRERFLVTCGAVGPNEPRDLRIVARDHGDSIAVVEVGRGDPTGPGPKYVSFVPHGLIGSYTTDGSPVAAQGASFGPTSETKKGALRAR